MTLYCWGRIVPQPVSGRWKERGLLALISHSPWGSACSLRFPGTRRSPLSYYKLLNFEKRGKKDVCPVLDEFLCHIAKTGETMIQWSQFKSYFMFKLEKVMDDFRTAAPEPRGPPNPNVEYIPFEEMKERILKIVTGFNGIPFTIQRLCELLTDPRRNYTGTEKFLRGVEKNVMVVSCVYPSSEKNNSNSVHRMNGVMFPGNSPGYTERSNINGPGTPRPLSRPKLSLSSPLTTNGLPDNTESKVLNLQQAEEKTHSELPASETEGSHGSTVKNKHTEEDPVEAEEHEVKRLKFDDDDDEDRESDSPPPSSDISSDMTEDPHDKESETSCVRQHCTSATTEESFILPREMTPEKDQGKDSNKTINVNEESNQMEESDQFHAEKDLLSEDSGNASAISSGVDCRATEERGTFSSATPEIPLESPMENSDETTDAAEEPMEQD
ncbi:serine/threonine-protein phosphatase 4 regulatory subunit 2 isoform X1 [Rhinatrema bivittatum]|uniref:serine/threonine-protein phosphatase 4 regulatory subunit 2 isoform X1 n=1 Tax=Rhinatrema bivittatum TaxID=194408 RepID=UPI00112E845E|nr:serine/threonine-protein phosphatase 4 regulatory subunit 2 isoform X1 [Rhinatrema bivittatum]